MVRLCQQALGVQTDPGIGVFGGRLNQRTAPGSRKQLKVQRTYDRAGESTLSPAGLKVRPSRPLVGMGEEDLCGVEANQEALVGQQRDQQRWIGEPEDRRRAHTRAGIGSQDGQPVFV